MSAHTFGIGPLSGPFGSGTHWAGKQTVTQIQLHTALALEEARDEHRAFSGLHVRDQRETLMRSLHQRGPDGNCIPGDALTHAAYGPIPATHAMTKFQRSDRTCAVEVPAEVYGWQWSTTFGRWTAFVRFADGLECFTYPWLC